MKTINFPNGSITMAGHLYLSESFSEDRKYAAIVPGASHIGMYDKPDLVAEAMSKFAPFFKAHL
jgi:fermentation-respiration switch protein FrsA (DUF1100 family)